PGRPAGATAPGPAREAPGSSAPAPRALDHRHRLEPRRRRPVGRPRAARRGRGAERAMNALPDPGVGSALRRLRTLGSLDALFREAAQALCENLGFDRAAVFSVRGRSLTLESVHARDADPRELEELEELAADPPPLGPGLHESEVLRRQRAVLVEDALDDPRALGLLPGASSFVAAPVVCHQRPVALIHADLGTGGHVLTDYDRETVWAFAEGFGCALERCVLASRLREQSARVVALARSTEASVVALSRPEIELDAPEVR